MSRYALKHPNGHMVAYGLDHVLGYFYDEFYYDEDGERVDVYEASTVRTSMSKGAFNEFLVEANAPGHHINAAALCLPFGALEHVLDADLDVAEITQWDVLAAPIGWRMPDGTIRGFDDSVEEETPWADTFGAESREAELEHNGWDLADYGEDYQLWHQSGHYMARFVGTCGMEERTRTSKEEAIAAMCTYWSNSPVTF